MFRHLPGLMLSQYSCEKFLINKNALFFKSRKWKLRSCGWLEFVFLVIFYGLGSHGKSSPSSTTIWENTFFGFTFSVCIMAQWDFPCYVRNSSCETPIMVLSQKIVDMELMEPEKTALWKGKSSSKVHSGVSKNNGTPKWLVYKGKPYEQMGWFGGPTPIFGNTYSCVASTLRILTPQSSGLLWGPMYTPLLFIQLHYPSLMSGFNQFSRICLAMMFGKSSLKILTPKWWCV